MPSAPLILDSVTHLLPEHAGRVAYCASHGGRYAGWYAASRGIGAVILNDAGVGREQAGIAGLSYLDTLGIAAACVSHRSARIGDGQHGAEHGLVSHTNESAACLGLVNGMTIAVALERFSRFSRPPSRRPIAEHESRFEVAELRSGGIKVVVLDSISLVTPNDAGHVVVTASHGGLLGGRPETAVKYPVFAVVTNDADRGIDDAGIARLAALEAMGIAGACVSAFSARIGDGRSTLDDGYISTVNETARSRGGLVGQNCRAFAAAMVDAKLRN